MSSVDRRNDFDALRLVAALAVLVGHAWPLTGVPEAPRLGGHLLYHDAVYVFFAISGFLITSSWIRSPRPLRYLRNRALRIFPALALVVLVTVFGIGPLVTTSSRYLAEPATWSYLGNIALLARYELPGVFAHNPVGVVNGSLWTLGAEFACYLGVLVIGLLLRRWAGLAFGALLVALAVVSLVPHALPPGMAAVTTAMAFFAGGALLAGPRVAPFVRLVPALGALAVWLVVGMLWIDAGKLLAWLVVPYVVIALGTRSTPGVRAAGRFGDVSYGLYLWGFPVQQLVVLVLGPLALWLDVLVVVPITLAFAAASWHLVERRALALKAPSRRAAQGTARVSDPSGSATA